MQRPSEFIICLTWIGWLISLNNYSLQALIIYFTSCKLLLEFYILVVM